MDNSEWTYFIQSVDGGPIKIGYTRQSPKSRLASLQTGAPVKLNIIGLLPGNRERELHKRFEAERSHGEWFTPSKKLIQFISKNVGANEEDCEIKARALRLNGRAIKIEEAIKVEFGASWFDDVYINDEMLDHDDLSNKVFTNAEMNCQCLNCTDGDAEYGSDEYFDNDEECSINLMSRVFDYASYTPYIEKIGVNSEQGWVCFICAPLTSAKRRSIIEHLAWLVYDLDNQECTNTFWFASFYYNGKEMFADLIAVAMAGGLTDQTLFDLPALISGMENNIPPHDDAQSLGYHGA